MSIFTICIIAAMTRWARALSGSASISGSTLGAVTGGSDNDRNERRELAATGRPSGLLFAAGGSDGFDHAA